MSKIAPVKNTPKAIELKTKDIKKKQLIEQLRRDKGVRSIAKEYFTLLPKYEKWISDSLEQVIGTVLYKHPISGYDPVDWMSFTESSHFHHFYKAIFGAEFGDPDEMKERVEDSDDDGDEAANLADVFFLTAVVEYFNPDMKRQALFALQIYLYARVYRDHDGGKVSCRLEDHKAYIDADEEGRDEQLDLLNSLIAKKTPTIRVSFSRDDGELYLDYLWLNYMSTS